MDADLFLQQFGHLAQGKDGIKKLRDVILQLAVQGKLVEQNPADEPAEVLLKRIEAERKPSKKSSDIVHLDAPHVIPTNWEWVKLPEIALFKLGRTPKRKEPMYWQNDAYPWVSIADLKHLQSISYAKEGISELAVKECFSEEIVPAGTLLMSFKLTIGKTSFVEMDCFHNEAIISIFPYVDEIKYYLFWAFSGLDLTRDQSSAIKGHTLNKEKLNNLLIPLPPLAEQKRIVAKVDALMALCDRLEAEQTAQRTLKTQAVQSTLHHLRQAENPTGFDTSLNILENSFGNWFDDLANVKHLRATILQLAVQGKLVPQSPTDEPASELLKRIKTEKKQLIADGKIKKPKPLPPITKSDHPFTLPHGWEWVRFEEVIDPRYAISYGVLVPGDDYPNGVPFVRLADLDLKNSSKLPEKSISPDIDQQYERTRLEGGEILMGVVGSIGKLGIAPDSWKGANIARAICRIVPSKELHKGFLIKLLASDFMQSNFKGDTRTLAQPTLNIGLIRSSCTPLPPLAEQKRIVAKLDELIALCDQLEANITQRQTTNTHLMDSLINRMTEAA